MWFTRKPKKDPAETMRRLREQALQVSAVELSLAPTAARPNVWGVLMETGYPEGVATLVGLGDGTTSLYFSDGGGVIGAGEHDSVHVASEAFISAGEKHLAKFTPAVEMRLPELGRVRFYLRTFNGTLNAEGDEQELGYGRHELSPLFHAGHVVITALREATERGADAPGAGAAS